MATRGDANSVVHYSPQGSDAARKFQVQTLPQEFEEVDSGTVAWTEICSIKYLSVRVAQVKDVIAVAPQIPLLASAGARHRTVTAEAQSTRTHPKHMAIQ